MDSTSSIKRAFKAAVYYGAIAAASTGAFGIMTGDYRQMVPAIAFAFVAAGGTAAKYERTRSAPVGTINEPQNISPQ